MLWRQWLAAFCMPRKYRSLLKIFFPITAFFFVFFRLFSHFYPESNLPMILVGPIFGRQGSSAVEPTVPPFAYASLLCDDVMIDAVKVLIYSLKQTGTPFPFILLILPQVRQTEDLIKLGAQLHMISPLDYPFKVSPEKAAINKMCRYSKLHIWRFIQYKKIVFIDVDCLVSRSLDKAFKWPEFSAVRDAGDTFNTGLFVLEPSLETHRTMIDTYFNSPSYNQGDQGFINWHFRNSVKTALPVKYNTVCKHKTQASWPIMKRQAKMIHFTSETKPWNFFSGSHKFWKQNFDSFMYYLWAKTFRKVAEKLRIDVYDPRDTMWLNIKRVGDICESTAPVMERLAASLSSAQKRQMLEKISVVIFRWRSLASLHTAIYHYRRVVSPIVAKVYISWNPGNGPPPPEISKYKFVRDPSVELIFHRYESPNNIWNPIYNLPTKAVFYADDEHLPDLEKLEITLETWRNNQQALVGFFPRYHSKQKLQDFFEQRQQSPMTDPSSLPTESPPLAPAEAAEAALNSDPSRPPLPAPDVTFNDTALAPDDCKEGCFAHPITTPSSIPTANDDSWIWAYNLTSIRRPKPYSMIAAPLMLVNSEYLFVYTCVLPQKIHQFVDDHDEDFAGMAMNLLATGMSGSRPIVVKSDFGDPEAHRFNSDQSYALIRGGLLKDLTRLFAGGGTRDILQYNSLIVTQFNRIPFKKRSPKQWNNT